MRHIMVLNSKGGSGKSTIATSLAAWYAGRGENVALVDYDQQASSLDWLARRPANRPQIAGVAGFEDGFKHLPRSADLAIIDAPAGCYGKQLTELVRHAETVVVPVLPSTIDILATTKFIDALREIGKVERKEVKKSVGEQGLLTSSNVEERAWDITVKNLHKGKMAVRVLDRKPFSSSDKIEVETLAGMTPPTEKDYKKRRGVMAWSFDAAPGSETVVKTGYRITWPQDMKIGQAE